ncbi:MAG: FAD-binding oxidoreductase, partial [Syntrophaceae bacterium]|nr:FAD-binding oxidoreductase [Syntrophaceae bacterium]
MTDFSELKAILDERRVSSGESVRHLHSHDESFHAPSLPDVVVWPHTTEEASRLVRWAREKRVPVTAWGAGTSLEGNPIPVRGGMVMD